MITGKLGKTASGLLPLKEKNNAQGVLDMGMYSCIDFGGELNDFNPEKKVLHRLKDGDFDNVIIFGEDPLGTAIDQAEVKNWFSKQQFLVVQDYFMTETAKTANLILPASFPIESAGSFTNTQRVIQQFEKQMDGPLAKTNFQQLNDLSVMFGLDSFKDEEAVFMEIVSNLPKQDNATLLFNPTENEVKPRRFKAGADHLMLRFDEEFESALKNN
jgi:predicted molibdopterin-dependent oxidoreductase YjgC